MGGANAAAFAVNDSGSVAGTATTMFGYSHAFSSNGGAMTDLTLNSGASYGFAAGINNSGAIAGTQIVNGQAFATLWSNGTASAVAAAGSYAMAINDSGQIAGMLTTVDGQGHAFIATNGSLQDLGTLAGGSWSSAYAINANGEAAGYGVTSSGAFRGFTWTAGGGLDELGTLGGANSYAMAIDDAGTVAGSAQLANGAMHAFISSGDALIDLGTLGGMNSYAYGISASGEVVGYSGAADGSTQAFLYDNGVMIDLNSLIDPASGWVLTQAYAINASGEIAGAGWFNGAEHAFLLDPSSNIPTAQFSVESVDAAVAPEPATFGIALAALMILAARLRFRARLAPLLADPRRALRR
jgi:probable HAF family extracellular repeat protein